MIKDEQLYTHTFQTDNYQTESLICRLIIAVRIHDMLATIMT